MGYIRHTENMELLPNFYNKAMDEMFQRLSQSKSIYSKTPHKRTSGLRTTSLKFVQTVPKIKEPLQADKSNQFLKILIKLLAEIGANRVLGRKQNTVILPAGIVFQPYPACICLIKTAN